MFCVCIVSCICWHVSDEPRRRTLPHTLPPPPLLLQPQKPPQPAAAVATRLLQLLRQRILSLQLPLPDLCAAAVWRAAGCCGSCRCSGVRPSADAWFVCPTMSYIPYVWHCMSISYVLGYVWCRTSWRKISYPNISIVRYRMSDVQHRTMARIQRQITNIRFWPGYYDDIPVDSYSLAWVPQSWLQVYHLWYCWSPIISSRSWLTIKFECALAGHHHTHPAFKFEFNHGDIVGLWSCIANEENSDIVVPLILKTSDIQVGETPLIMMEIRT